MKVMKQQYNSQNIKETNSIKPGFKKINPSKKCEERLKKINLGLIPDELQKNDEELALEILNKIQAKDIMKHIDVTAAMVCNWKTKRKPINSQMVYQILWAFLESNAMLRELDNRVCLRLFNRFGPRGLA